MRKITTEGYQRAAQHLEAAVQRDPSFILGWLDLSGCYRLVATFLAGDPASVPAIRQKAEATRAEALRRNPDDELLKLVSRMDEAGAAGLVALAPLWKELDPVLRRYNSINLGGVSDSSSQWLVAVDKSSEAIGRLEENRLIDPLDPGMLVYLSEAYGNTGRLKEALAQQEYGLQKVPNELLATNRLMSAAGTGDPAQVRAAWARLMDITSDELTRNLYPLRDRPADARALLRKLANERPGAVAASRMALWAAYFGDPELALQALQADRDLARRRITSLALWRPVMSDARQLPGFKTLVKDWGFVDYWREYGWGDHCKPIGEEDFECR
jgi:tetratricopeptide (TPR) repeat protein